MTHEIEYTEFIDRYLENEMSLEERVWFEKELAGSPSLQQEVDFQKKVNAVLSDKESIELKVQLEQIHSEIAETTKKGKSTLKSIYRYSVTTAGVLGLLLLSMVFYTSNKDYSSDELLGLYYQPVNSPASYRALTDSDDILNKAINYYEDKEYDHAIKLFESVLKNDPEMIGINLYSGISHMEVHEYAIANERFQTIIAQDPNPFVESATWYLGLCYLYTNEREKAKSTFSLLVQNEGYYKKDARKILKRL